MLMKKVKFPFELDLIELCSPELQTAFGPKRELIRQADEATKAARKRVRFVHVK